MKNSSEKTKEVSIEKPTVVEDKKVAVDKKEEAKKPSKSVKSYSAEVNVGFTLGTSDKSKSYKKGDVFTTKSKKTFDYINNVKKYLK